MNRICRRCDQMQRDGPTTLDAVADCAILRGDFSCVTLPRPRGAVS